MAELKRHNGVEPDEAGAFVYADEAERTIAELREKLADRDSRLEAVKRWADKVDENDLDDLAYLDDLSDLLYGDLPPCRGCEEKEDAWIGQWQDFICAISDAVWGGELGWCDGTGETDPEALKKLARLVRDKINQLAEKDRRLEAARDIVVSNTAEDIADGEPIRAHFSIEQRELAAFLSILSPTTNSPVVSSSGAEDERTEEDKESHRLAYRGLAEVRGNLIKESER